MPLKGISHSLDTRGQNVEGMKCHLSLTIIAVKGILILEKHRVTRTMTLLRGDTPLNSFNPTPR